MKDDIVSSVRRTKLSHRRFCDADLIGSCTLLEFSCTRVDLTRAVSYKRQTSAKRPSKRLSAKKAKFASAKLGDAWLIRDRPN